jgi:hypothetical protein
MSLYQQFKTDEKLEKEGILVDFGVNQRTDKPIRFRIARAGGSNITFAKAMEKATRPHKRALHLGTLSNDVAEKIYREVFIDTVLLDWEEVDGSDGQPLPFTRENAVKLFTDLPDLFAQLREDAGNAALFLAEVREADLGNSGRS